MHPHFPEKETEGLAQGHTVSLQSQWERDPTILHQVSVSEAEREGAQGWGYGASGRGDTQGWVVTLALAGQMLARRSQMVLEGMQPAERITSGRVWGQTAWPVSPQDS